jgi:hypothetical protein
MWKNYCKQEVINYGLNSEITYLPLTKKINGLDLGGK